MRAAILVFAAALVAGCGGQEQPARPAERVVKLGFAAPLTGPQAHYGKEMQNGVLLALDEIDAERPVIGGRPVRFELLAEDDQADPKQGTLVAQKLVDRGIAGMLGHFNSGTSIPASRIYAEAGIPQIAMATAPAYTAQGYKTTFRAMTNDTQQVAVIGRFAVEKLGARRVAVIDDRTAYGQGLADEFEKAARAAGAEIVRREFTTDKAADFTAILTSIKAARPDAIFFGGADAQAGPMARQIRQLGIEARFMGGEMVKSATFLRLAGAAAEGTVASLAGLPLARMPGGKRYEERYRARFNAPVEIYSPYAYDATRALVAAMKRADSVEPRRYLPELAKTRMAGVTSSSIAYDEKGDLKDSTITVYRVAGGEWKVLETAGGK
ncbi:MAG: branched-chain amino acid ABC transporter substrate-binding protein [Betaproteobacteria bacterium]|nr:branched-chain amino acid ABC transporter substrate-binding protein [Betaproteobacteria bacterium]